MSRERLSSPGLHWADSRVEHVSPTKHLKAKICLVGEGAVGKTSLIRRCVRDEFEDSYLETIGTKVSKKTVEIVRPEGEPVVRLDMAIWDVMGQQRFRELLKDAYFSGVQGVLAVADFTRRETLDELYVWIDRVDRIVSQVPVVLVVNKVDLTAHAQFGEADAARAARAFKAEFLLASAKNGANVEEAFLRLGALVARHQLEEG